MSGVFRIYSARSRLDRLRRFLASALRRTPGYGSVGHFVAPCRSSRSLRLVDDAKNTSHLDWLGVVLAALAALVAGSIWYAPPVFGNRWAALVKRYAHLSDDDMKPSAGPLVYWFVGALLNASALAALIGAIKAPTVGSALVVGIVVGLGFGLPLASWPVIFARQPRALWLLNAGAFFVMQIAMTLVLGLRAS